MPPQRGKTALDHANAEGHDEVVALLEAAQAPALLGVYMMDAGSEGGCCLIRWRWSFQGLVCRRQSLCVCVPRTGVLYGDASA